MNHQHHLEQENASLREDLARLHAQLEKSALDSQLKLQQNNQKFMNLQQKNLNLQEKNLHLQRRISRLETKIATLTKELDAARHNQNPDLATLFADISQRMKSDKRFE